MNWMICLLLRTWTVDQFLWNLGFRVLSIWLKYNIIPPMASFARNTRLSSIQHPYAFKLDTNRTNAFTNSFIPKTSRDWNSLPPTVFPATYNLQSFKTYETTYTLNSDPIPKSLLISKIQWFNADYRGCIFLVKLLLVSVSL